MSSEAKISPFLTRFATQRIPSERVKGWYSEESDMWMIDVGGVSRPAIDSASSTLELATKTAVQSESDDDVLPELLTKTDVKAEQDDENPRRFGFH